jgi:predicted thioesterase
MPLKKVTYKSDIDRFPSNKIYINVKNMEKGDYEIHIVHNNKVINKSTFVKK